MKILRLRLTNLNSLRGTTAIDFTVPPLADCGLFAITGPTGAGKTTLLDALTLALYGRVARYGSAPSPDAVMSRHTGECSAEVEFACATGCFRSVWQLQRAHKKPDGKLQSARRRVIALPDERVVAETIKEVDAKLVELTGLDYDRFLRSVLLAQGEFATFLRAGPKDRTELLQEVTGTAIYQDISQAAFRRCAEAQTAHERLIRDHAALPVLAAETRAHHEARRATAEQRLAQLARELPALVRRITDAERWLELERTAQRLAESRSALAESERAAAAGLVRLDAHERAAPLSAALATSDQVARELARDAQRLGAIGASLPARAEQLRAAEAAQQLARAAWHEEEQRQAGLRTLWAEVTALDHALGIAREAVRSGGEQHAHLTEAGTALAREHSQAVTALEQLAAEHRAVVAWLREHTTDAALAAALPEIQAGFARWAGARQHAREAENALTTVLHERTRLAALVEGARGRLPALEGELQRANAARQAAHHARHAITEHPLADLESQRDAAREHRTIVERLAADARRLRGLAADLERINQDAAQNASALQLAVQTRAALDVRRTGAAQLHEARRKALGFAERVQSLESHRAALHDGEPCPLCGAEHHPFARPGAAFAAEIAAARRDVEIAGTELKSVETDFARAEKNHTVSVTEQKRTAADLARLHPEHATLLTTWNVAAAALGLADRFAASAEIEARLTAAQTDESRLHRLVGAVRAAEAILQANQASVQEAQTGLERVRAECTTHEAVAAQAAARVPAADTARLRAQDAARAEREIFARHLSAFTTEFAADLDETAAAALCERLKRRDAAHREREAAAQSLLARVTAQTGKIETIARQLAAARESLAQSGAKLATARDALAGQEAVRRERFGDRSVTLAQEEAATSARRRRAALDTAQSSAELRRAEHAALAQEQATLEIAVARRADECRRLRDELTQAATATGFTTLDGLRSALLPSADTVELVARRRRLEETRVALASETAALQAQRTALAEGAADDGPTLGELRASRDVMDVERAAHERGLGETLGLLKHDDEQRLRQTEIAAQIATAHGEFARWDRLRALIGSADGSAFARFAQGLTLERLTVLANRHLAQLSPRYAIRCATGAGATDLELEIVDHYQADATRPMRSLSGGETFLASLALALGLSELASGRTTIESLFIDEGFGSLDLDTLETAMAALDNLQARGKTIGVISHVPAMQERIPTQIVVRKEAVGCSSVTIMG